MVTLLLMVGVNDEKRILITDIDKIRYESGLGRGEHTNDHMEPKLLRAIPNAKETM